MKAFLGNSIAFCAAVLLTFGTIVAHAAQPDAAASPGADLSDTSDSTRGLDLAGMRLAPIYEADFTKPLRFVREDDLFVDGKRIRRPEGADWVLEGKTAETRVEHGCLSLQNAGNHLVFWNTREFPSNFLLEFGISPADPDNGLAIVFFAAKGRDGGGIFDPGQPRRDGEFKAYHSGGLDCYHSSYWAVTPAGDPRGTAHIRKNYGFHIVAKGRDFISGQGAGPHRVRVLKVAGQIDVEVNGKLAVHWVDDGKNHGPVLQGGFIGLRQMSHAGECRYTHFKVWAVE
ncbi:MAG: hypothetical protein A3G75_10730 [Verrucomicrobia bacterium RIFCSPLOWO2_12_FULL_64_8]|nr:MAG: hypothetical protein A3G75_10730 [Verrucomicrobia bacterium RIFCSPLOWO2_12_FULL_64_8]